MGLLVTGQHHVGDGLLQVLSLLPQGVLEVILQGLYHVTQEKDAPGQMLSLFLHDVREQLPVPLHCLGISWVELLNFHEEHVGLLQDIHGLRATEQDFLDDVSHNFSGWVMLG